MNITTIVKDSLPRYLCELPHSKIKTKYRPFLVKEEKKLLILEETSSQVEIYDGIIEVLNACFDNIDFSKIPLFEVEYCFLQLRAKSVGEILTPKIICPETGESKTVEINLNDIQLKDSAQENMIQITDNLRIYLKYPTIDSLVEESNDVNDLLANCITHFEDKDEKRESNLFKREEIMEFLDNLTSSQYEKILNYFENMPVLKIDVRYMTSDGVARQLTLKGIKDFFS